MKYCHYCRVYKPISEFHHKHGKPIDYCKPCNRARMKYYHKRRKNDPVFIAKKRAYQQHARQTNFKTRTAQLWNTNKNSAKRRGIEHDISLEIYRLLLRAQDMRCIKTGIPFDMKTGEGIKPFGPGIDRKDSNKGYVLGNIQIVCNMYNFAKNSFSDEDVLTMARELIKRTDNTN